MSTRVKRVDLDFTNLAELDEGRMNKLLSVHLQRIAHDLIGRPSDKSARKVSLEFTAKPLVDEDGNCTTCTLEIECKSKVPTYRSKPYQMSVGRAGFSFNKDFPDALDQPSLYADRESDDDDDDESEE